MKGIQGTDKVKPLSRDRALEIFNLICGLGYGCAVKHLRGNYYVEVPVMLVGDKAYGKQVEIIEIAKRGGYEALQTGNVLRIA